MTRVKTDLATLRKIRTLANGISTLYRGDSDHPSVDSLKRAERLRMVDTPDARLHRGRRDLLAWRESRIIEVDAEFQRRESELKESILNDPDAFSAAQMTREAHDRLTQVQEKIAEKEALLVRELRMCRDEGMSWGAMDDYIPSHYRTKTPGYGARRFVLGLDN